MMLEKKQLFGAKRKGLMVVDDVAIFEKLLILFFVFGLYGEMKRLQVTKGHGFNRNVLKLHETSP